MVTAHEVLESAWRAPGFCVPNADTYPFQWLWDSCFHAVVWAHLGDRRGIEELRSVLAHQGPDGFVPHLIYWGADTPGPHADLWGRPMTSSITQPPMFGHAAAALARAGLEPDVDITERCRRGLAHLLRRPRSPEGLVPVFHPWETGCDDSLRWDDWCPGGFDTDRWRTAKGLFVEALEFEDRPGSGSTGRGPTGSSRFAPGSAFFTALVIWNIEELASIGEAGTLIDDAEPLRHALAGSWNGETWVDGPGSGAARTLEALVPVLVDRSPDRRAVVEQQLADPAAFAAPFGPRGVHRDEVGADPDAYWRGSTWPQLCYLLERAGLATTLSTSAVSTGWAEYWNPDTGRALGARPQTWTTLALIRPDRPALH